MKEMTAIFWVPEKKRLSKKEDVYVSGNVWEQNQETKNLRNKNVLKISKKIETKMLFPLSLLQAQGRLISELHTVELTFVTINPHFKSNQWD